MTDYAPDQPQGEGQNTSQDEAKATSFDVELVLVPSGRTHTVTGKGVVPIENADGTAETVYRLVANVDGEQVTLSEYGSGHIDGRVQAARSLREQQESEQG